ncbi:hypothetical protein K435DRAFT_803963 [Dendrothele bispora CBS 962.96]|uniref:RRM domain-containing protein n=1 Tax=Dendrothele bispora (strain CBS 962.96) TaxID=1314807 RepID=A0A4V4HDM6_DENBC|nr:hypothetical protein K435DRAFT_803963 [Dendrothele bispora CBS 962.96]
MVTFYNDRKPCIVPPAVQNVPASGAWTRFTETIDDEGRPGLLRIGKKREIDEDLFVYYDRRQKREIYLEDKPLIPRELVHDIDTFGMPGPNLRYWADNQFRLRLPASNWIYPSKLPSPLTIGQTAANPDPSLLPRIENLPPEDQPMDEIPPTIEDAHMDSPTLDKDIPLEEETTSVIEEETASVTKEETTSIIEEVTTSIIEEEITSIIEEQPRSPSPPYPEPPSSESAPFPTIWSEDVKNPLAPNQAPTMLLKFLGFHGVSLNDFHAFLHETLEWLPVEIKVTRIIRVDKDGKLEFWTKFFDGSQTAWAIRAYHRFWTTDGYILQLKLITLDEWRAIDQHSGTEEWSLPTPLLPKEEEEELSTVEEESSSEIGNTLANRLQDTVDPTLIPEEQSLADRLQDPPPSTSLLQRTKETLEDRLAASSAQSSKKRN